jgi:PKHD-type hydroxylase
MVRSAMQRRLLLDLDLAIQSLRRRTPDAPELLSLSGVYHNLLREWAEV